MKASITRFRLNRIDLPTSAIVAHFDVRVGDFHLRGGSIRVSHRDGEAFIVLPGRKTCGISLAQPSETRNEIEGAVLERYRTETGRAPEEAPGGW